MKKAKAFMLWLLQSLAPELFGRVAITRADTDRAKEEKAVAEREPTYHELNGVKDDQGLVDLLQRSQRYREHHDDPLTKSRRRPADRDRNKRKLWEKI